jgi:acetyl esterase/lipase
MSRQQLENILAPLLQRPRQRFSIEGVRRDWYVESDEIPGSLERKSFLIGNIPAERLSRPGSRRDRAVLYLHGGGYVCGSIKTHRTLTNELAMQFDGGIVSIDYRLAPEAPFPAAVDDAVAAYRHLLDSGCPASGIAIAGDSAGGGLAVATALQCRMQSLPAAGAVWAISPWANLTNSSAILDDPQNRDPIVFKESLVACAEAYLGKHAATDPLASPVLGDLLGLPGLLIQVGAR